VETPAHRIPRLITALEDMAGQEALLLRGGDAASARGVQLRMAPLIQALAANATDVDPGLRRRIAAIVAQRLASEKWLDEVVARGRAELRQMEADQRRLVRMRPAYTGPRPDGRRLSAVG
jgi:hypothetical protein